MFTIRTFRRALLTAALAVAAIPTLATDRAAFSRTILIGDSLSDSGYFRPVLVAANPQAAILGSVPVSVAPAPGAVSVWGKE